MKKIATYFGILLIVLALIGVYYAYFVSSIDPISNVTYDGFERLLYPVKPATEILGFVGHSWPGFRWFIFDVICFFAAISAGVYLIDYGSKK